MMRHFGQGRVCAVVFCALVLGWVSTNAIAQDADPKVLSGPQFVLSQDAVDAGIEGTLAATLSIDESGKVTRVRLHGEPMWPCGTSPERQLYSLRKAAEKYLRQIEFAPAVKNGKPSDSEVVLDFAISHAFKLPMGTDKIPEETDPKLVDVGAVRGRAINLVKPSIKHRGVYGIAVVRVLIDLEGNVSKAGAVSGNPLHFKGSRKAACQSKFSPTTIDGRPVRVTGVIEYLYN